jgi:hypothetical protein
VGVVADWHNHRGSRRKMPATEVYKRVSQDFS